MNNNNLLFYKIRHKFSGQTVEFWRRLFLTIGNTPLFQYKIGLGYGLDSDSWINHWPIGLLHTYS